MIRLLTLVLVSFLSFSCSTSDTKEAEGSYTLVEDDSDEKNRERSESSPKIASSDFHFMVGKWLDNKTMISKNGIQYMEKWMAEPNGTFSCQSYQIEPQIDRDMPYYLRNAARVTLLEEGVTDMDTIYTEKMTISTRNGSTFYDVTVFSQNSGQTIAFKLEEIKENYARFENVGHDFPQVMEYMLIHPDSLRVVIRTADGEKSQAFSYFRITKK